MTVTDAAERMRISQTVVVIDSTINLVRLRATRSAARGLSAAAELVVNHRMRPVLCPFHTARRDATVLSCRVVSCRVGRCELGISEAVPESTVYLSELQ